MKKIPTLYLRDHTTRPPQLTREVNPAAQWVADAEGIATVKHDGTCVLIAAGGTMFKRYETKAGKWPPADFMPAMPKPDPVTGKWSGWRPVNPDDPSDRWHVEAYDHHAAGTYELCGPKIQGNPEGVHAHTLIRHGSVTLDDAPRDYDGLTAYLTDLPHEGIVWHHPDGRMAKLKRRDFGLQWPTGNTT